MIRQVTRRTPQLAPLAVLFVLTGIGFIWFWQQTSTRPLLLLSVGIVLALVIDGVWSFASIRNPNFEVRCPEDARVGDPLGVSVRLLDSNRPVLLQMLSMPGSPAVRIHPPETGVLDVIPLVSGRFPWAIFELSARGPLGLAGWTRRMVVELPHPVLVAPRFAPHELQFPASAGSRPGHARGAATQLDLVRSVREYEPGDSSRLIHWGATARTGQLMVKELDPAGAGSLAIVLDLHPDHPGAEVAAGRAGFLAQKALSEGWSVTLVYRESRDSPDQVMPVLTGNRLPIRILKRPAGSSTTVSALLMSEVDVGRRLACADFGPPAVPSTRGANLVRLVSSSGEDQWL